MAIVADLARQDQNRNSVQTHAAAALETHIPPAYGTPTNNTADAWVPLVTTGSDIT